MELLKLLGLGIGIVAWIALLMLAVASPFILIVGLIIYFFG